MFELLDREPKMTGRSDQHAQPVAEPLIDSLDHASPPAREATAAAAAAAAVVSGRPMDGTAWFAICLGLCSPCFPGIS